MKKKDESNSDFRKLNVPAKTQGKEQITLTSIGATVDST